MCYPLPGPRCSKHAALKLYVAESNYALYPTSEQAEKVERAQRSYSLTPQGIADLRVEADKCLNEGSVAEGVRLMKLADEREIRRAHVMAVYKQSKTTGMRSNQDPLDALVNSPETADASQAEGDRIISLGIDSAFNPAGWDVTTAYRVDRTNGRIVVDARWSENDAAAVPNSVNFREVLRYDHQPTDFEAQSIADSLNARYDERVQGEGFGSLAEQQDFFRNSVVDALADAIYTDRDAQNTRDDGAERVSEALTINHTYASSRGALTGRDVQDAWSRLYA